MPRSTKAGKKTAVADVEDKLRERYGREKAGNAAVFGTLNKIGLMHGNRVTAKGTKAAKAKPAARRQR